MGLIIRREYLAKVRNRSFIVMTILSPLLIVGMIVLIAYLAKINDDEVRVVSVLDQSGHFEKELQPSTNISFVLLKGLDLEQAMDSTVSMDHYGLLYIPGSGEMEEVARNIHLYTKDNPNTMLTQNLEGMIQGQLRQGRLKKLGISTQQFSQVEQPFELKLSTFEGEKSLKGITEIKAFIGGAFGYAIMMFIIIYGGFVMRSVIEEKTSRIIELIISSVRPFQLMLGKIIGTSLAGITQFAIWIVSASLLLLLAVMLFDLELGSPMGAGELPMEPMGAMSGMSGLDQGMAGYAQEIMSLPWGLLIGSFFIYFILGYLIYSSIYAAIGAAVDNETDTQQFIFPIILPLMLAIYVGFFSVFSNPHGPIAVGFSLFPLTSPIVMLMRLPGGIGEGGVPLWQFLLSIFLLIVSFWGIVSLAAKIYRIGILMYGKKPTYRELIKWLRY